MFQKLLLFVLIISLCPLARAQAPQDIKDEKPDEAPAKQRAKAVAFLREAVAEANNLRSIENRISFTSELASLMWNADEREAKAMFNGVISDFRELVLRYDAQMNALGTGPIDDDYMGGFLGDLSDKARLIRKFSTAMSVHYNIAANLAERDAAAALNFYYDSRSLVSNPELQKLMTRRGDFENKLLLKAAAEKPELALQFAARSLEKGFSSQSVDLLRQLYDKNPEKGIEFGAEILRKIKSDGIDQKELDAAMSLLSFAEANREAAAENNRKIVYSPADLREIADIIGRSVLRADSPGWAHLADLITKYAPGRAAQIRARFPQVSRKNYVAAGNASYSRSTMNSNAAFDDDEATAPPPPISTTGMSNSSANAKASAEAEREKADNKMMQDVMSLGGKELPKEEREKIIANARKTLADTPRRDKKIGGLTTLAGRVAAAGDRELASAIMKDAAALVNPSPKNYQDFMFTWMLASGYAAAEPEAAFVLLDDTIIRANSTIDAFVKVAEFIDVTGEMVDEGEVQVGAFGGSMIQGLTGELGIAAGTISLLAASDFDKTAALANRFDRPEVRMLAKMLVLRAVLTETKAPETPVADK